MSFEILTRNPIKFYEKDGIKFFEKFKAADKYNKPVDVFIDTVSDDSPIIKAKNFQNKDSEFMLQFNIPQREMEGVTLNADPRKQGLGEILNLAGIIEFHKNNLNKFKVFSLQETIQLYTRYGFKLVTNDVDEILHNLKMVMRSKSEKYNYLRYAAKFYAPKLAGKEPSDDPFLKQRGCEVVSNYLQALSKEHKKIDPFDLKHSSNMQFTDWEIETNRDYLNSLMDLHKINYKV